ncbi:hypothetical protein [Planomonospora sphaerica]|uniref:hypothetical protein n=1 Tax=Planomonospora sphaerica TaxID=161355 RepID=UPI00129059BD|nr:hypothetical protein [Planomonospora sphaerica]
MSTTKVEVPISSSPHRDKARNAPTEPIATSSSAGALSKHLITDQGLQQGSPWAVTARPLRHPSNVRTSLRCWWT